MNKSSSSGVTLIELLFAVAAVFVIITIAIVAGSGSGSIDNNILCLLHGGVPSKDRDGLMTRCDFPINIYGR